MIIGHFAPWACQRGEEQFVALCKNRESESLKLRVNDYVFIIWKNLGWGLADMFMFRYISVSVWLGTINAKSFTRSLMVKGGEYAGSLAVLSQELGIQFINVIVRFYLRFILSLFYLRIR